MQALADDVKTKVMPTVVEMQGLLTKLSPKVEVIALLNPVLLSKVCIIGAIPKTAEKYLRLRTGGLVESSLNRGVPSKC